MSLAILICNKNYYNLLKKITVLNSLANGVKLELKSKYDVHQVKESLVISRSDAERLIDEDYLRNINVTFSQKYGPINSVVLSRSAGSDNVYLRDENSIRQNGLCEVKISDNQIMNFNDRDEYLPELFSKLNGVEYYLNDFKGNFASRF